MEAGVVNRWIVVGTDFSPSAQHALEYAIELAGELNAKVACVHAYEDGVGTPAFYDPVVELSAQVREAIAACTAHAQNVVVEGIVRRGAPWDKLLNVATELGADIIVIGAD